jgi:hypothetical protein
VLLADVSERSIGSIFIGRWMNLMMNPPAYEGGTDRAFRNVGQ